MNCEKEGVGGEIRPAIELDRTSPIPLYLQIKQALSRQIAVWERRSDKFYTDSELCDMFGVSRMTVRQAVQELVDDGLLKRSRGIGTFVVARKVDEQVSPHLNFRGQGQAQGRPMTVEVLGYDMRPCPPGFAEDLGVASAAPVRYVLRLRRAGTVPIALDHRYLPQEVAAGYTQADAANSVIETLWKRYRLDHGDIYIEATTAGQEEVRWLGVALGSPLLMRRLRYVTDGGHAVVAGYTVYRADLVRYSVQVPLQHDMLEPLTEGEHRERVVRFRREVAAPGHDER